VRFGFYRQQDNRFSGGVLGVPLIDRFGRGLALIC
jgi:hypothetical protein